MGIDRMAIDDLHLCVALGPLAAYLMLLGLVNISRRPLVASGVRDAAALGLGISGLVIAGPMELFWPESASTRMGPFVWLLLLAFYVLCLTLVVLLMRPRLVIFNTTPDQLRPVLAEMIPSFDPDARWMGEMLLLPRWGIQLYVDSTPLLRIVQLVATGPRQNPSNWRRLEDALAAALRGTRDSLRPQGLILAAVGLALAGFTLYRALDDPTKIVQALNEMLRR